MRKKLFIACALMLCVSTFAGCSKVDQKENLNTVNNNISKTSSSDNVVVTPLPSTIDMEQLDNCALAVSLKKGDAFVDDSGVMQMKVTVYTYDLYDMVDIAQLKEGDTIVIKQEDVSITSLENNEYGTIIINGGLDQGGYELYTDDNTVFYENGYSDVKSYYELGEVTIPVSSDFLYTDTSDLDKDATIYYPGDFLTDNAGIDYNFTPYNTSIIIVDGYITSMNRLYTP